MDTTSNNNNTEQKSAEIRQTTQIGMVANLALSLIKFAVGLTSNSHALVADAVHSLSDCATDIVVLVGVRYWSAPPDECHPHGHGRIETLISVIIGIALGVVGVGLAYNAIQSLHQGGDAEIPGFLAFWAAMLSLISKEILYQWSVRIGRKIRSGALIANAWHHRSDALSSLPVAIAVAGMSIWPQLRFLDQIATIVVAVFILGAARKIVWPGLQELIDIGASQQQLRQIQTIARETQGVRSLHKLRSRHIGNGIQVDLHIQVEQTLTVRSGHDIARDVKKRLINEIDEVVDVLIHVEPDDGKTKREE